MIHASARADMGWPFAIPFRDIASSSSGVTSDTVLAHYYVHERGARIYDGPDEVHKMVVAKRILGRYTSS